MDSSQLKNRLVHLQAEQVRLQKMRLVRGKNKTSSALMPLLSLFVVTGFLANLEVHGLIAISGGIVTFIIVMMIISKGELAESVEENGLDHINQEINALLAELNKPSVYESLAPSSKPAPRHSPPPSSTPRAASTSTSTSSPPFRDDFEDEEPIYLAPKFTFAVIVIDAIFKKYKRVSPKPYSSQLKSLKQKISAAEKYDCISSIAINDLIKIATDIRNDFDPFDDEWLWEKLQLIVDLLDETSKRDTMMSRSSLDAIDKLVSAS